jgi:hypothetical protein
MNTECMVVPEFEKWNYVDMAELAKLKKGIVAHEGDFQRIGEEKFTPYQPAISPLGQQPTEDGRKKIKTSPPIRPSHSKSPQSETRRADQVRCEAD